MAARTRDEKGRSQLPSGGRLAAREILKGISLIAIAAMHDGSLPNQYPEFIAYTRRLSTFAEDGLG